MRRPAAAFALALGAAMLASPAFAGMSVTFDWGKTKACFDPNSPPFVVNGVPKDTVRLIFQMTDLNVPTYRHGGGVVAYTGQKSIPYGAFQYKGPCPPQPHVYQFNVQAMDGKGKVLATATARKRFPR